MKLGAENKKKTIIAAGLMAIAVLLLVRMLSAPRAATTTGAARTAAPRARQAKTAARRDPRDRYLAVSLAPTLDPRLRLDLLKGSEDLKYTGSGRNIFSETMEEIPKPVAPGLKQEAAKWTPPPPPPPPPINLKFFGWASRPGEAKKIFLSQGDEVFVAGEGDIVGRRYKVVRIGPSSVEIEDVLSNNRQSIPLTQG